MITNKTITYYQKTLNEQTRLEEWNSIVFNKVWVFSRKGATTYNGYQNANNIEVRIPMQEIADRNIFKIGDIIAIGEQASITRQSDLDGKEYFNVTSVTINDYGSNPHIHLGGN